MKRRALLKAAAATPLARLAPLVPTGHYWVGNVLHLRPGVYNTKQLQALIARAFWLPALARKA